MATTTSTRVVPSSSTPRRNSTPLLLVTAGIMGLVLQTSLPSCSFDLSGMLDSNKTCGAQLAQSIHQAGGSNAERVLGSAACKGPQIR
ncbi:MULTISPECIES: hypothetical protein [Ramlibacter]|uniref:Uncharacterized protein n=1 Tax=Ramlibacter aquaticus TaxID=2780094 RepID=A0ABR9SB69_9BURK|nr:MULTISPECIES: hypothetical protein [Ramlibacter]MBE7939479.1 hypothetical protein [Ramlibacter aquaticus]